MLKTLSYIPAQIEQMLRPGPIIGAIVIVVGASGAGDAATSFQPVNGLFPSTFVSDVKGGQFDEIHRVVTCSINAVSATLRLSAEHPDPKWLPSMSIIFNGPNLSAQDPPPPVDTNHNVIALRLQSIENGRPLSVLFTKSVGQVVSDNLRFATETTIGQDIQVVASWTTEGAVTATIGKEQLTIPMGEPVTSVEFVISGGKGEFRDLKAGYFGSAKANCDRAAR